MPRHDLPDPCPSALQRHLDPELFRALGDPVRLTLLARIAAAAEPLTVNEASACCGVHLSGVSRHLKILLRAGAVEAEKRGREVRYRVAARPLIDMLRGLADALEDCCPPKAAPCCSRGETDDGRP